MFILKWDALFIYNLGNSELIDYKKFYRSNSVSNKCVGDFIIRKEKTYYATIYTFYSYF